MLRSSLTKHQPRTPTSPEEMQRMRARAWQEQIRRYRSSYVYRGLPDATYNLQTSLMRLGGAYASLEGPLLRTFRRYAQSSAVPGDSIWNWLAVA